MTLTPAATTAGGEQRLRVNTGLLLYGRYNPVALWVPGARATAKQTVQGRRWEESKSEGESLSSKRLNVRADWRRDLFPVLTSALTGIGVARSACVASEPGAPRRWWRAPAGRGCWGSGLHSLGSACQQLPNPITSSGSGGLTTSPERWIMITIQNDNMQREAVRKWNQISDVWKVWEQRGGGANHPEHWYFQPYYYIFMLLEIVNSFDSLASGTLASALLVLNI